MSISLNHLSRREFLAGSSAASVATAASLATVASLATLPLVGTLQAAEPKHKLKLGLVTYNWGKDWDLPTILKNCEATGYLGVELRSTHKHGVEIDLDNAARRDVKKRFADSPVENVGLGSACEYHAVDQDVVKKNIEETKAFVKLCKDTGGSGVKVRPNGLPAEVPVEKTLEQIGRSLNIVGKFAADYGVQIRVEVHGKGTQEIPNMKTIMDVADHPNVVVCWNCNPADLNGLGFEHNYQLLDDRMGTVHIHDLRPGINKYPWDKLFPRLLNCTAPGFTGWCLMEEGPIPEDILQAMHENRLVFEQLTH